MPRGLAYLFIGHDLKEVRALASEIIVMRDGKVVESGPALESNMTVMQEVYWKADPLECPSCGGGCRPRRDP